MNKSKLKQLAEDAAKAAKTTKTAAQAASEPAGRTSGGINIETFQARIYAAIVGGSNFRQTMAGKAVICREAFETSRIAIEVWLEEKGKSGGRI